jgi:hypothetical protein
MVKFDFVDYYGNVKKNGTIEVICPLCKECN